MFERPYACGKEDAIRGEDQMPLGKLRTFCIKESWILASWCSLLSAAGPTSDVSESTLAQPREA